MASLNSPHFQVFTSLTAKATFCLACQYLSAASAVPQDNQAWKASYFSLTTPFTAGLHDWVWGLPPWQAQQPLQWRYGTWPPLEYKRSSAEDLLDRDLCQICPAHPDYAFGSTKYVQNFPCHLILLTTIDRQLTTLHRWQLHSSSECP